MNRRKLRLGAAAAGVTVFVLAAAVALNLLVGAASERYYWSLDMTEGGIYELTDETTAYVGDLYEDVTVTVLRPEESYLNGTYGPLGQILKKYAALGGTRLTLRFVDPDLNAAMLEEYGTLGSLRADDVIVSSRLRYRVLHSTELYQTQLDQQTYQYYITGIQAEQKLTAALMYVSNEVVPSAAFIEGHGESGQMTQLQTLLENNNYTVRQLNTATEEIPSDVSLLVLASPKLDISPEEAVRLEDYFTRGGSAWVFFDLNTPELPVLERYLTEWGVAFERSVILDGVQGLSDPAYVVPELGDHEIATQMQADNMMSLLYAPRPIDVLFESYGPRTVTPLLTTSENSYAKPVSADAPITTMEREDGDESGPFPAAVLSEQVDIDASGSATRSRVFFAATTLADDSVLAMTNLLNVRFMNSVAAYMSPSEDSVNIAPREMPGSLMNVPLGTAWVVMILLVAVLPLCLFGGGLAVWLRRRHL